MEHHKVEKVEKKEEKTHEKVKEVPHLPKPVTHHKAPIDQKHQAEKELEAKKHLKAKKEEPRTVAPKKIEDSHKLSYHAAKPSDHQSMTHHEKLHRDFSEHLPEPVLLHAQPKVVERHA